MPIFTCDKYVSLAAFSGNSFFQMLWLTNFQLANSQTCNSHTHRFATRWLAARTLPRLNLTMPGFCLLNSHVEGQRDSSTCIYNTASYFSYISQCMTKLTKWNVYQAKMQISLGICPVWSESLLCTQWVAKDPMLRRLYSDWADAQAYLSLLRLAHMPFCWFIMQRLIW